MQTAKNIFITGTNRGLGKALAKLLHQDSNLSLHVSSRKSAEELNQQLGKEIPNHRLNTYQIDLNNPESIFNVREQIRRRNISLDGIVANAAVGADFGLKMPTESVARNTLTTNVTSTIDFVKQFLPLLSSNGRVVLVSAALGAINGQPQQLKAKLNDPNLTENEIIHIANDYIASVVKKDMGYYNLSAYKTSKALLNSWARFILPTYLKPGQTQICLHPGWCKTDLGGKNAPLTAEQGAQLIKEALELEQVDPSKFYNNKKFCDFATCM